MKNNPICADRHRSSVREDLTGLMVVCDNKGYAKFFCSISLFYCRDAIVNSYNKLNAFFRKLSYSTFAKTVTVITHIYMIFYISTKAFKIGVKNSCCGDTVAVIIAVNADKNTVINSF